LFLGVAFGCSLKLVLEYSRLTEPSLKPFKVFEIGLLAGSSSLHTFIIFFGILIVPKTKKRDTISEDTKK